MSIIRVMTIDDYDEIYKVWLNTDDANPIDDRKEGISK